jgi:ribosomal protein S7
MDMSNKKEEFINSTSGQGTDLTKEFLKEMVKRSSAQNFEIRDDGIYRGDKMIMPVVVEDVQVIDDVDGIRYIVRLRSTVPPKELTCVGDLDDVYECVKSQVPVLNSHIARNALMHAIYIWLDKHGTRQAEPVTAMDKFFKLINEILAVAQLIYSRLKPSVEKVPSNSAALYGIIAENPAVTEAIQKIAYGAKVTVDGLLCIPIETLKGMNINVEELEMSAIEYKQLIEVVKTQEFKTALELLGIAAQEDQAELTIQRLNSKLRAINNNKLKSIINNQDPLAKAVKALMGLAPIKHKVKTPQGRTLWALCMAPPRGGDNANAE